jgi:SAM-dependent methyltransferase
MVGVFEKIRWSLEQRGVAGTVTSAAKSVGRRLRPQETRAPHPFDVENGVETDGLIAGHDLGVGHANDRFIAGYAAIPPSRFRGAMERWQASRPAYAVEAFTFVDFGCGKGRAALLASELGFREVVGVELNTKLAELARANAAIWTSAGKARSPIRIVCGDALELDWPEGPCLVYLYNPFAEQVMRRLAERMRMRFVGRPNQLEVVYQKPEQAAVFEEGFEMVWSEAIAMSEEDWAADLVADPKDESRAYRLLPRRMS